MKWSKKIALMTPVISAICLFGAVNAMQSSYRQPGATPSGATPFDWCETSEGRSVREMAVNLGLSECVNILGPRSRKETIRRIRQADLLLLLAERFVIQIPGKTYEYLRAGRPILALTSEGALANFLLTMGSRGTRARRRSGDRSRVRPAQARRPSSGIVRPSKRRAPK